MCGIAGIVDVSSTGANNEAALRAMLRAMTYRGPDDEGVFTGDGIALGSGRLAILDLSPNGHMPMASDDGRYQIVHNGEVYNFAELRSDLEQRGVQFRSGTDTEVILQLFIHDGASMLSRCNGMFAFAIWDTERRELFAARDRLGIKPLYYSMHGGHLTFASEEKALFAAGVPARMDEATWQELLLFRYVAGTRTPYDGVQRLAPGHYLQVRDGQVSVHEWWNLLDRGAGEHEATTGAAYVDTLEDSIRLRRISDVPIGVLLSGGLDSSTIGLVAGEQAPGDVASFTVRFYDPAYDEGELARALSAYAHLEHHELGVAQSELPTLLQDATRLLDAPSVHASDPHLLAISRVAKPRATVLLSGEGADETLGGYVRHRSFRYPRLTRSLARFIEFVPNGRLPRRVRKIRELHALPSARDRLIFSSSELLPNDLGWQVDTSAFEARAAYADAALAYSNEPVRQVLQYEQLTYLPSILDRSDRMTMGASIECRLPFLDHRLVTLAGATRTRDLVSGRTGKRLLRSAMADRLPAGTHRAPKWGFGVPWHQYLRSEPGFRRYLEQLADHDVVRSAPVDLTGAVASVSRYLAGDDTAAATAATLFRIVLWHDLCVANVESVLIG